MVKQLKAIGGSVIGFGVNVFRFFQLLWYIGFLLFAALLVHDLIQIPISVNSSHEYAPEKTLWAKMTPEDEAKLEAFQARCRHLYAHNGLDNYYCPICRKKLTKDRPYIWRV